MAKKWIGYDRVSTTKQGRSGLGQEAQQAAVMAYVAETGGTLVASYTEVETGTGKAARPELDQAIAHARFARATLVIAKMDRLTRNLGFLTRLEDSRVDFVACDMPHANKLTVRIMVMVAEQEAEAISARTRDALSAYKANRRVSKRIAALYPEGVPPDVAEAVAGRLGASLPQCRNLTDEARRVGARAAGDVHKRAADAFNGFIAPRVREMRAGGMTLKAIANALNSEGVQTRRGKAWSHVQVLNILKRYGG